MTDEEKILRFAGFRSETYSGKADDSKLYWHNLDGEYKAWVAPDGQRSASAPDTADLTWLFKWCVPKLAAEGIELRLMTGQVGSDAHVMLVRPPTGIVLEIKQAGTPSEALRDVIKVVVEQHEQTV